MNKKLKSELIKKLKEAKAKSISFDSVKQTYEKINEALEILEQEDG